MTHKSFLIRWFYNLPIRRKQLTGLFASELISIIGLVGVGAVLIVSGGRTILFQQAKSELIVSQMSYDIKINQMGFGFRGQSDNSAIIAATRTYKQSKELNPGLRKQVKQILQNEITARDIEYAILLGKDLRIIVNANANANTDNSGEIFNPNNLVSKVLQSAEQIKTSEIITRKGSTQESLPSWLRSKGEEVLIRYTITPVKDRKSKEVLGVLLSGDVVNRESPIVKQTLNATDGGYSAIYLRQSTGKFRIAAAALDIDKSQTENLPQASENNHTRNYKFDVSLADDSLLQLAAKQSGKIVTRRLNIGGKTYTVAAKSINNFANQPVAVLLRGTPETDLNALLRGSLFVQGVIAILALLIDIGLAILLGRAIIYPIKCLQKATKDFSRGNLQARAEVIAQDEVGELASNFNSMVEKIAKRDQTIVQQMQELKDTLEKLKNTQAQLIQTEKMSGLGQMVAGIAHEINNPINFIYGNIDHAKEYTEILIKLLQIYQTKYPELDSDTQQQVEATDLEFVQADLPRILDSMEVGAERIKGIVYSLRNFSRIDEAEFKAVDIHEGIDSTLMILNNRLKGKAGSLKIEIIKEYGKFPLVECYPGQLNQVFMNLIGNAIDSLEEQHANLQYAEHKQNSISPTIWISTQIVASNWVVIKIKDNGQGINENLSSKLFEPFFTTKTVGKGTGLGLSISYQIIVERHHGTITCNSTVGDGAEFVVKIPIQQTTENILALRTNP